MMSALRAAPTVARPEVSARMLENLRATVREQLDSETFGPDELVPILVERGYDEAEVRTAITEVAAELEAEAHDPARLARQRQRKRSAHMVRFGLVWLAVGVPSTFFSGGGVVAMLVVFVFGATLVVAGLRALRRP